MLSAPMQGIRLVAAAVRRREQTARQTTQAPPVPPGPGVPLRRTQARPVYRDPNSTEALYMWALAEQTKTLGPLDAARHLADLANLVGTRTAAEIVLGRRR